jgi:hypothetical protein
MFYETFGFAAGVVVRDTLDIAPGTAKLYTGMQFISLRSPVVLQNISLRAAD